MTPQAESEPVAFVRPNRHKFSRLVNKLLPSQPEDQVELNFGELKKKLDPRDYLLAIPMLVMFITCMVVQYHVWRGFIFSPLTAFATGIAWAIKWLQITHWALIVLGVMEGSAVLYLLIIGGRTVYRKYKIKQAYKQHLLLPEDQRSEMPAETVRIAKQPWRWWRGRAKGYVGFLTRASVLEEQWFREGAENWNKRQRLASCVGFAILHMANLFYSVATLLPLAIMGYMLMHSYLREYRRTGNREQSVLRSSKLHRIYNRVALWATVVQPVLFFSGFNLFQ